MAERALIIIGFICLEIFVHVYFRYILRKKDASKKITNTGVILKYPDLYRDLPMEFIIFFLLILIGVLIFAEEKWQLSLLILVVLIPIVLIYIIFSIWQVEIRKEGFIYRNYFGKIKEYRFCDGQYKYVESKLSFKLGKYAFFKDNKKVFSMPNSIKEGNLLKKVYTTYRLKNIK